PLLSTAAMHILTKRGTALLSRSHSISSRQPNTWSVEGDKHMSLSYTLHTHTHTHTQTHTHTYTCFCHSQLLCMETQGYTLSLTRTHVLLFVLGGKGGGGGWGVFIWGRHTNRVARDSRGTP